MFVCQVFGWLRPTLASMVHLLALYHHYSIIVELILELFCETAKRILCYFTAAESRVLYESSLSLIRTYADHQVGKRTVDKEAEEEQYRDLLLLMELLTNLLSKDFIDLSPPDSGSESVETVTAADVCLYGLNIIMPLMSAELLKFPNLCLQYFKTITFVCEIYPEKVVKRKKIFFPNSHFSGYNPEPRITEEPGGQFGTWPNIHWSGHGLHSLL